eukprot:10858608-Ditylum_brightwellii.AAC.1
MEPDMTSVLEEKHHKAIKSDDAEQYGRNWHKLLHNRKHKSGVRTSDSYRFNCLTQDLAAGRDDITHTCNTSWWQCTDGFILFFWRWTPEFCVEARDGPPMFEEGTKLLNYWECPRLPSPDKDKLVLKDKISTVVSRQYIERTFVKSLRRNFGVPKGEHDTRIVCDTSKCSLNNALWAPNFGLPNVDSVEHTLDLDLWFGDVDIGEIFLNYPLHPKV